MAVPASRAGRTATPRGADSCRDHGGVRGAGAGGGRTPGRRGRRQPGAEILRGDGPDRLVGGRARDRGRGGRAHGAAARLRVHLLRADQVVSGTGINILALGITGYVFIYHYGDAGHAPRRLARAGRDASGVEDIPFIGDAIGQPNLLTWAALLLVPLLTLFLFRTRGGLRLRSVGEKPRAADSVGLPSSARATSRSSPPARWRPSAACTCRSRCSARSTRT